jgi:hypothetical protein
MHPLLRYALLATPLAALVFLWSADFFTTWSGQVVSVRAATTVDAPVLRVLVVEEDRSYYEIDWPKAVVDPLDLDVDNTGVPRTKLPEDAPTTSKDRFSLSFTVTPNEGATKVVPTTSARALSLAFVTWLLGLFLHNMWLSGSPWSWERREFELPKNQEQGTSGQPQEDPQAAKRARSRKGPPPARKRRGAGRRR